MSKPHSAHHKSGGIEDILDIPKADPIEVVFEEPIFSENAEDDTTEDYKFIRRKLRYAINAGEAILQESMIELRTNPGPRVVEGCSLILKTIVDTSEKLMNVHEKLKKMRPPKEAGNEESAKDENGEVKTVESDVTSILQRVKLMGKG